MPIVTSTDDVAVGMRLHEPAYAGARLLLPAGKTLNSADVDFLRSRAPGVALCVVDPVLDELVTFDDDRRDREIAQVAQTKLVSLLSDVQTKLGARMSIKSRDCVGIEQAVQGVLTFLEANPVMAMHLIRQQPDEEYLVSHAAQVFYLSLVTGNAVRSHVLQARPASVPPPRIDLGPLALAALFMDIAMLPMKDVYWQSEPLSIEQLEQIRQHPLASAEMLPSETPEMTKLLIETHHENYDGTGYPYGLKGDQTHIFARILRIADAYAAATATHIYKEACSPVNALWQMTWGTFSQFYDPILIKIFLGLMQPYPIGAKLFLSSGEYGVVVRFGKVSPFLPEIVVAFDGEGRRLPAGRLRGPLKLEEIPDLRIVSFMGEDVSEIYDRDTKIRPVTRSEFTTLYESVVTGCATLPL